MKSFEEENRILAEAGEILETLGNTPGITPIQFFTALDNLDILDSWRRAELLKAAASIEMMMLFDDDIKEPTIH